MCESGPVVKALGESGEAMSDSTEGEVVIELTPFVSVAQQDELGKVTLIDRPRCQKTLNNKQCIWPAQHGGWHINGRPGELFDHWPTFGTRIGIALGIAKQWK